jgi:hypothetical protein
MCVDAYNHGVWMRTPFSAHNVLCMPHVVSIDVAPRVIYNPFLAPAGHISLPSTGMSDTLQLSLYPLRTVAQTVAHSFCTQARRVLTPSVLFASLLGHLVSSPTYRSNATLQNHARGSLSGTQVL